MPRLQPFAGADDATLVDGCVHGDEDAWAALRARYGALVQATVVGALDGPRAAEVDLDAALDLVWRQLRADEALALRQWRGESLLRSYLAVLARHVTVAHTEGGDRPVALVAALPTPSGLLLDDLLAIEPAARIEETIGLLPPNITALVRLRLRGLSRDDVAATLGMSPATARGYLERIASRLGERDAAEAETTACWRVLLDAADPAQRVAIALKTEEDRDFREVRSLVEKTWRAVRDRALSTPTPKTALCLDDRAVAGFVDGSLRGAPRARAEGHVATCPRCIDEAAALVIDLRALTPLRDGAELDPTVAVAAACVATTRFEAAERLTRRSADLGVGGRIAGDVRRLAQAGQLLAGGSGRREQTSQVVATHVPDDAEAPLVAFEALVLDEPQAAWRAIDDHMAKQALGRRLRLLADAAGRDLEGAARAAARALEEPRIDPGLVRDAQTVQALPPGRALPREILVERLRTLLPEAVRFVLSRDD
ncbi:MAG TPA: hypothetical protein RMH99_19225 [Sandaracinaceae bacterium LLY-WYZ-13_1]|nr:hypothetical protein [Sandaracinaceae bacterium LLY-WYZ-13_1]